MSKRYEITLDLIEIDNNGIKILTDECLGHFTDVEEARRKRLEIVQFLDSNEILGE